MRITVQAGAVAVDLRGVDMSTRGIRIPDDLWFAALARYVARK